MNNLLLKFKRLLRQFRGFFPEALPFGKAEFDSWVASFKDTYELPTKDDDSVVFALSTMIMHLGPTVAYKPKQYFLLALRAAAAKQVAGSVFYDLKQKQQAAAQAKQAEATAISQAASDGPSH